ncbi:MULTISPECIES: hypothetical protein [unclassified Mycobacterium]|uniref:hypothetical protein n=1 Tax=unclassified Mycobacterium TaxID=2642494 RepID=UPI00096E90E0|nr:MULTISPECIES: hypothetical protein [unclassified Mycobacterium]
MATFLKLGRESTLRFSQVGRSITKTREHRHVCAHARSNKLKAAKLAALKPKKKCCRSKPRCKRCPVVLHKVAKAERHGLHGIELEKVFKRARKA